MSRHDTLIVKETHRGLLYEDGVLREVLPAGRHQIPRPPRGWRRSSGPRARGSRSSWSTSGAATGPSSSRTS